MYQSLGREEEALKLIESLLPYAQDEYLGFESALRAIMLYASRGKYDRACDIASTLDKPFEKFKKLDRFDKFNLPPFFSKFQFSNFPVNSDYSH